ncbi:MAG: hypothetical protein LQ346_007477 [Caloplaca aetnensis]|nr:MAG: hypothetical protein LQ346_007477 [Caloplaca aetnensis]
MEILELPIELLILLPEYLHNIEDFMNLSSTCRKLHNVYSNVSPRTILQLAVASSRTFFRPDPHFLIAATVRQVSDWALLSHANTEILRQALRHGVHTLLDLCVSKAGLTMNDIRHLHACRFSLINPVSDMIDACAGPRWLSTPNFWQGGVSAPATVFLEPTRALFQIVIYGELFASSMDAFLHPRLSLPRFDQEFRMEYIKYCIPDLGCESYYPWDGCDGMTVYEIGPYADPYNEALMPQCESDQEGLDYLLSCRIWREAWAKVRLATGPDFETEWRQELWCSAIQIQGLEGLEMLRPGGLERWRPRLEAMRQSIEDLTDDEKPRKYRYGSNKTPCWESPHMAAEILVAGGSRLSAEPTGGPGMLVYFPPP